MLTNIEIIDYSLNQAQLDSSFRPDARLWFNIILQKLTDKYNYPFYRRSVDVGFIAGKRRYTLPTDFKKSDEAYQINSQGVQGAMIPLLDAYPFRQLDGGNTSGPSSAAYIDEGTNEIVFNTELSDNTGNVGFRLFYFKKPKKIDLSGLDDNSVSDFRDQNTLMEELKAEAYEFRNDDRYMQKRAEAKQSLVEFQRNQYNDDSYSTIPLNAVNFRSNNRRSRTRGFRG